MLRMILEAMGLRMSHAERCAEVSGSVSRHLINAASAMRLNVQRDTFNKFLGFYDPLQDVVAINIDNVAMQRTACVNNVLAHELIHATGHHLRLDRAHVGMQSFDVWTAPRPTPEQVASEEVIAQYGAKLLLWKLGVESPGIEEDTTRYLKRYGRPEGPTESEALEAVRAVKYILNCMDRRVSHASEAS